MRTITLLVLMGVSGFAGTIGTFTFTGTATGTIGGTVFTGASLVVTGMGDLSTVSCVAGTCDLDVGAGLASFTIGGIGSGTFSDETYFFDNQVSVLAGTPAGLVGFGDGSDDIQMYGALIGGNAIFSTYDLQSAVGPLGPQVTDGSTSDWVNLPTSLGGFTVSSFTNFTFQATAATTSTPEPGSLVLAGIGLAGLLWKVRRG